MWKSSNKITLVCTANSRLTSLVVHLLVVHPPPTPPPQPPVLSPPRSLDSNVNSLLGTSNFPTCTRIRALVAAQEQFQGDRERANERDEEIEELKRQLAAAQKAVLVKKEVEDSDESDVEDAQTGSAKKDLKTAGSVAAMVCSPHPFKENSN